MDIQELKKLAQSATPGPWYLSRHGKRVLAHCTVEAPSGKYEIEQQISYSTPRERQEEDAGFIAAANPAAILELIAEIEKLRRLNADYVHHP